METKEDETLAENIPKMNNLQVIRYLVFTHHEFTRNIMDEIAELIQRAHKEITDPLPELTTLGLIWKKYHDEMRQHLTDEERILFPWIEQSDAAGRTPQEVSRQYSGAIRQMLTEHKHHETEMDRIRMLADAISVSGGYVPVLALLSYKLRQLNRDLAEHMRIETGLLFPRILSAQGNPQE